MSRIKEVFCFIVLFCCSLGQGADGAYAQKKGVTDRADAYFENYEYIKAIPLYKKAADKNDDDALRKLADCYRILKNYSEAELSYGKLAEKNSPDPMVYYYFGEALLHNHKFDEAKKQFLAYSGLNPNDNKGLLYAKACDDIKNLLSTPALYKVDNLGELNSPLSDFCPVLYKDELVFASERIRDIITNTKNKTTGNPYLSLVYAKGKKEKDSIVYDDHAKLFNKKFSGDGYYGPACFNADFTEIYYTKVDNLVKRGGVSQPKLYWSKLRGGKSNALPFVSNDYATAHPSLSKDGQYLFFASDMPGGQGGTDIWVSKKEGGVWGSPQNLGPNINTKGDETFPYISPSAPDRLYFSSNGHPGFGGLDIFFALQKEGIWDTPGNMMFPINSTGDDFGIIFKNDNSGYLSSNRMGGKGGDDLYEFALSGLISSISGKILLSKKTDDGAQNVNVFLLSDKGTILHTTRTDGSGSFQFENLLADQSYMIKIDENDPSLVNQKKFYLADANNKVVRVVVKGNGGIFVFENLPADLSTLSRLSEDDLTLNNFSIAGNLYSGENRVPIENTRVNLSDEKGQIVQTTTTNAFGSFVFVNISPDQNFTLTLNDSDPKLTSQKIYFTNKSGKEISVNQGGIFKFQLLASDKNTLSLLKVEESQLLVDLKGTLYSDKKGKDRLAHSKIHLVDDMGKVVKTSQTDGAGNFKFVNLEADKSYMVRLNEDDPSLTTKDIFLADGKGKIMATLKYANGKFFHYVLLPMEEQSLVTLYFDDPWLRVATMQAEIKKDSLMIIIENVYYEYQKWELLPEASITLNKVVDVMKANPEITIHLVAHTDSRGSDDFNMKLSEKRAQTAVDYIIAKGIDKNRLAAKGMGETQLVNHCSDGIECSEDEHAQNRRTEFKVKKGKK